ncbi:radical SAM family heme chaperone HemW [Patiriisocius hiemis]|uniref:Heme chaperone HemW n=1 Tax=Patiriisocius hiemis TaxID=3075604 RepID=A0ABU2YGI0_9FLAO|nr:radical SAM family heme chaperone HemW [Constantimarinum sp. W242]MDT0556345.1 radical SAM family heme chaperone HemW [Constantimarinum sp. W242]
MAGIYIHIPFCKQACHYCDFHFSTSLKKRDEIITAICKELELRKHEMSQEVTTIYFGGGTPSVLMPSEIELIINQLHKQYKVISHPEITLEANPDDLSEKIIREFSKSPINRLSIGVQSFFEEDLKLMNRAHNAAEAYKSIELTKQYFENYSIDLIYGIPQMSNQRWLENIDKAMQLNVPHLSCYALTVEPNTALQTFIKKGVIAPVEDAVAQEHHSLLVEVTEKMGYNNYEFSNFGKKGFYSQNNMAYWQGKPYLGVGPSAHSYNGEQRSWNIANNSIYLKKITKGEVPQEIEKLSLTDKYNEYVMTRLRTMWGISLDEVNTLFGKTYLEYLHKQAQQHITNGLLEIKEQRMLVTKKGKFLSDGIASDLFLLNLQ